MFRKRRAGCPQVSGLRCQSFASELRGNSHVYLAHFLELSVCHKLTFNNP